MDSVITADKKSSSVNKKKNIPVADKEGIYKNFSGEISFIGKDNNLIIGHVKNADFELSEKDNYSIFWWRGVWKDGIWMNGCWNYGSWIKGTWLSGTWEGGDWYNGAWENGRWNSGNWYNGRWYNGAWFLGTWYKGIWTSGEFKFGFDSKRNLHEYKNPNEW